MFWLKNTAFFRGCMVRAAYPEIGERWIRVLKRLGINAIVLPEERCCGSPLKNAGATKEYEENGRALREILERYHVGEIITACPACAHTLSQYAGVPARHVVQVVADRLNGRKVKPLNVRVAFHDPCHLARYLGVVEEPRKVLEACGCEVVGPELSGRFTYCCGGGGGVPANHPDTAGRIAKERAEQLESTGADIVVTSCPMCLHQLRKYSGIPVLDLSEVVAKAVGVEE